MHDRLSIVFLLLLMMGGGVGCPSSEPESISYEFGQTLGRSGTAPGEFRAPIGVEVEGETVYVSEAGNARVQVFDRDGTVLRQIGPSLGTGDSLRRPMHIAVHDSALYVPDYNADRIYVFSARGPLQRTIDGGDLEEGFDAPGGVAVDREQRIYVADFYHHRTLRLHREGTLDRQWGVTDLTGPGDERFTYPTDVASFPDGGFVVADAYNHRIKRYDADGALAWMRPKEPMGADSTRGGFNVATAVATDADGRVYVADFYNHRIQVFAPDGSFVTAVGTKGSAPGQFERPVDVAVAEDGTLYVVDFGNDRIQTFRRSQ